MKQSNRSSTMAAVAGLRRTSRHLGPFMRRERWLLIGGAAALAAEIGLRLLEPWPLKFVVDRVLTPALQRATPVGWTDAVYASTVAFSLAGHRVTTAVRAALYRHLQTLSLTFHSKARAGDLTMRVMSDVGVVSDVALTALVPLIGNTLVMAGMASLMLWMDWRLGLAALATLPLFWLLTLRTGRKLKEVSRQQRRREGAMAATAAESISAIKTLQALSMERAFAESFSSQGNKGLREGARASRLSARLERGVDVLLAVSTALVIAYGAWLVLRRELSTGDLLVFLAYLKSTFKPLQDVAKYTGRLAKAAAAGDRIVALLDEQPDVRNRPDAVPAPAFTGAISFRNVTFGYSPGRPAVVDFQLEAPAGCHIALMGPSGSGKSTVAALLQRLHDPTSGQVAIDGQDLRTFTLESVRTQMSVVLQDTLLFAATIRDNLTCGLDDVSDEAIEAAARLANAHDFVSAMPEGYQTVVGERGATLSGGQRQRLAIARAALRHTPILILDEPAAGLDEENERQVLEALARVAKGRTVLSITHNPAFAARADLIVFLEAGRVMECGTPAELLRPYVVGA
jgi:ATP-binding cassette subfamily B protein